MREKRLKYKLTASGNIRSCKLEYEKRFVMRVRFYQREIYKSFLQEY